MKKDKIKVAILCGGKSAEHEVSLLSAKNIIAAIDKKKYQPILIGIDKVGRWILCDDADVFLRADIAKLRNFNFSGDQAVLAPQGGGVIANLSKPRIKWSVDVVFPVLHGPFGEDGTVQGLLKLANVPFVGAGVLGSAVGMDKDVMKRLLRDAGLPIADFLVLRQGDNIDFKVVVKKLGLPLFIKPANLGSSVGVSKVRNELEFKAAAKEAFKYDNKILAEEFIRGREIECAILGDDEPMASLPGEIVPNHEFYSYEAKYLDENGALLKVPADLPKNLVTKVQQLAVKTFETLACGGMARVDFFLAKGNKIIVNEINTIPGFTSISMYPRLWQASGISYTKLIDKLIQLAIIRYKKEEKLKTSYK